MMLEKAILWWGRFCSLGNTFFIHGPRKPIWCILCLCARNRFTRRILIPRIITIFLTQLLQQLKRLICDLCRLYNLPQHPDVEMLDQPLPAGPINQERKVRQTSADVCGNAPFFQKVRNLTQVFFLFISMGQQMKWPQRKRRRRKCQRYSSSGRFIRFRVFLSRDGKTLNTQLIPNTLLWFVRGAAGYWRSRPLRDERGGTGRREEVRGRWHWEGEFGHFGEDPQESEAGPLERKCAFGKVPFLHLLGGVVLFTFFFFAALTFF